VRSIPDALAAKLHRRCDAARWDVSVPEFAAALSASAGRAFDSRDPSSRETEQYLNGLHLDDVALAIACANGHAAAWDAFVEKFRPVLYRAADTLDPTGGARELADAIYADLYGTRVNEGRRDSLLRHYHGRSSLATWLRAVLAQRHVDRIRATRRLEPLPEEEGARAELQHTSADAMDVDPARSRRQMLLHDVLSVALEALAPRDRLRLACYYQQGLTLAATGRILKEHEATVSRQLARTRRALRQAVEDAMARAGLSADDVAEAFAAAAADAGTFDLDQVLGKESVPDRSI
jgi:RNA polymerase sigma-70 factor (ECF subfamily)